MNNYEEQYWAERAGKYNKTNWVKNEAFIEAFLGMLPQQDFKQIFEVGIGTGVVAEKITEKLGPLTGIDISKEMIAKINHPQISAIVGDAHDLPFGDSYFDLIYMRNVIHYIDNPQMVFSEIHRCLINGGYFLFSQVIPPDDSISEEYDWLVGRNIHYPNQGEINELLSQFKDLKMDAFILENQSIMNWLNNTCNDEKKKQEIIKRHRETSEKYKSLANLKTADGDILVDIKHIMILGSK